MLFPLSCMAWLYMIPALTVAMIIQQGTYPEKALFVKPSHAGFGTVKGPHEIWYDAGCDLEKSFIHGGKMQTLKMRFNYPFREASEKRSKERGESSGIEQAGR